MNKIYIDGWKKGWSNAISSVFEFLREMEKVDDLFKLQEEYNAWENADYVILPNGDRIDKCTGEIKHHHRKQNDG